MQSWENLTEQEFKQRQKKAKDTWESMSDDQKERMVKLANEAVRSSSKTGSKLEKFLLDSLIKNGYRVEFHKEQNLLNTKLQIDIFLPEINTAIEVDGPSHFLPVWGEESLKRNIKYDNKKTGLLLGKGCAIIRIKQTKDFSPARASLIAQSVLDELAKIKNKFPEPNNRTIEIGD
jgi:very-short-patch-repair endonuclease